jgi:hypothetical protein
MNDLPNPTTLNTTQQQKHPGKTIIVSCFLIILVVVAFVAAVHLSDRHKNEQQLALKAAVATKTQAAAFGDPEGTKLNKVLDQCLLEAQNQRRTLLSAHVSSGSSAINDNTFADNVYKQAVNKCNQQYSAP